MKKKGKDKVQRYIQFLQTDIWRIRANKLPRKKSFWIRQLRIILLAVRGFAEDKCQLRASALTFYSLLSVVPVVAMGFGIAKGFGFEKKLEAQILKGLQGQQEVAHQIIDFSQSFLENTQGGLIAGVGVFVLFWTIIKVLGHIESSFNNVWGIKKGRSFGRKFSDYLSIMMICPILLIMSSSITVLVTSQVTLIVEKLSFLGPLSDVIIFSLRILPYAMIWGVFTFIYIFMPNTTVRFRSGLLGGIIAGTTYQIVQWIYITFQVGVGKFGAIYGSFAALPLFLVWLQTSWLVVLFGAEVSFAEQNVETYEFEPDCLNISYSFKRLLSLGLMHACVKNFHEGREPLTAEELAHRFELPIRLVHQIVFELTESGLLSEVKSSEEKTMAYQPALDIDRMTVGFVMETLDQRGVDNIPLVETDAMKKIMQSLHHFRNLIHRSPSNFILKDI